MTSRRPDDEHDEHVRRAASIIARHPLHIKVPDGQPGVEAWRCVCGAVTTEQAGLSGGHETLTEHHLQLLRDAGMAITDSDAEQARQHSIVRDKARSYRCPACGYTVRSASRTDTIARICRHLAANLVQAGAHFTQQVAA